VVECRQRYTLRRIPHRKIFENVHRTLREIGAFPRANAERQQRRHGNDHGLAAVLQSPSTTMSGISNTTGVAQTQVWRSLHHDGFCPYHLQRAQHLLPVDHAVYNFVNGCNHNYPFCVTLYSRIRLNLPGMVLLTQGIRTLGHTKIHEVIFNNDFRLTQWFPNCAPRRSRAPRNIFGAPRNIQIFSLK
jgi:hypothetical protein